MAGSMMIERPGSIGLGDKMDPVQYLAMIAKEEEEKHDMQVDEEQLKEQETGIMELGNNIQV